MRINEIVKEMQDKGIDKKAIIKSLETMLKEQKISQEDFDNAISKLDEHEERKMAFKVFDYDL